MSEPRISVLMLTFNRPQFISRAIQSVVDQTYQGWELLVVHDGPNHEIEGIMRDWAAREPRVRYFRRQETGNIAEANNFGLTRARGEYVAILDDDDYWASADKLATQLNYLDAHPGIVGCGGGSICIGLDGRELLRYRKPADPREIRRVALLANPMIHSTTLYRKDAAARVGFYDESLAGYQDWDLWLKLLTVGDLANAPDFWLYYQIWEGGGTFAAQEKNTAAALTIVRRHGGNYRGRIPALGMAWAHHAYAHLPLGIRRLSHSTLNRMKKMVFSTR